MLQLSSNVIVKTYPPLPLTPEIPMYIIVCGPADTFETNAYEKQLL